MVAGFPRTEQPTERRFEINGRPFSLATSEQLRALQQRRHMDVTVGTAQDGPIGQAFALHGDFRFGYGFTFTPGLKGYEGANGWDATAPGKIATWPQHATLESIADVAYRGWWHYDYSSGYLYLLRGRYATKYAPDDSGAVWSILEHHVFGTSGEVVCGQPAAFAGKLYVPLATAATGSALRWHELTTIATPVTEVQTVAISGTPTAGSYTLSYNDGLNTYTTAAIAYNADGPTVQAALRLLPGLSKVTVATAGSVPNYTHTITMTAAPGALATASPPQLTSTDGTTGGTHAIAHATTVAGTTDTWTRGPATVEANYFTVWNKGTVGNVLVRAKAAKVSMASTTPTTAGNWSTEQTVDDSGFNITALATIGRLLYVGKPNGVFSFDESGIVVAELPSIASSIDLNNFVGMREHNGFLYMPHKLGLIRWRPGAPYSIVGAEEDDELEGDRTGFWGQVRAIAPYGKFGYVTVNDFYNTQGAVASLEALHAAERGPLTPHMHHQLGPVEDLAVCTLKVQPASPLPLATWNTDASVGTLTWSDAANAAADDASYAQAGGLAGQTYYLKGLNLNATGIPSSATILGITARVKKLLVVQDVTGAATLPGTGANLATVGTHAWTNPGNITADDDTRATVSNVGTSQGLRASNFGFAIPSVATILGVEATVNRSQTIAGSAANTGVRSAGSGASPAGNGTWANPTRITAADGSYAQADGYNPGYNPSTALVSSSHGFTVPTDATITGIVLEVLRRGGDTATAVDSGIYLTKNGSATVGSNKSAGATWPTTAAYASFGGSSDLWGTTWTPAEINASTFGMHLTALLGSFGPTNTAQVDHVRITVYYTTGNAADYLVQLVNEAGAVTGSSKASAAAWPTSEATASYGSFADTWGATLTPAIVNDSDFGLAVCVTIPSTTGTQARVDWIKLAITYQVGNVVDTVVKLVKGGTVTGNNLADTATQWPSSEGEVVYGSSTNLWGTTLTAADVTGATFGLVISATITGGGYARVGYVTLEIAYSIPGASNPASYLVVLQTSDDALTAEPTVYKLPAAGLAVANDPQIAKHITLGAALTTGRVYGPTRATVKRYVSVEGYAELEAATDGASTPGFRVEAQVEDSGTWSALTDYDGADTFTESGPLELYFPDALAAGRWVQLRAVIDAAAGDEVGVSVVLRDLTLRGYVLSETTDESQVVLVLESGALLEDGMANTRGTAEMRAELDAAVAPPRNGRSAVVEVHDPVLHRTIPAVIRQVAYSEINFPGSAENSLVAVVKYERVRGRARGR